MSRASRACREDGIAEAARAGKVSAEARARVAAASPTGYVPDWSRAA
jgi:hypothetical protein